MQWIVGRRLAAMACSELMGGAADPLSRIRSGECWLVDFQLTV